MSDPIPDKAPAASAAPAFDKQGDKPDPQRVQDALSSFVRDFGATAALHMDACVHCGECAEACHFYVQTGDPKYTPILKVEPFKQTYKREVGPFAFIRKWLTPEVTLQQLEAWEELIYDSCTLCGRCTMVCPMGIDIPGLVETARHGMYQAGLVPTRLYNIANNAARKHTSQSATPEEFIRITKEIEAEFNVVIPVDRDRAQVLMAISASQLESHRDSFANTARILAHMGLDWTLCSQGFEATNFGMLSGFIELQKELTLRLVHAAVDCQAKVLLLPECGHAYGALRYRGPEWYGKPFPFEVLHMSEFLGRSVSNGSLRVRKIDDPAAVTYHDPCQAARRGGIHDEPRAVLSALGMTVREMAEAPEYNWCCGGGGGVLANDRAEPLRAQAFKLKMAQVEETGASKVVSACHQCELTFERGRERFHWDIPFINLVELVAAHLAEPGTQDTKPTRSPA